MRMKKSLKIFLITSIILISIIGLGLIAVSPYLSSVAEYRHNAEQIAASSKASDFRSTETSVIYDVYGDEITTISGAKELYYLESDKIPDIVKSAFVLIEDRKFYRHSGIDIAAVVRAGIANFKAKSKVQGASTITQQVARNVYLTQDVTWERKITEMFLAMELEKKYSKEQILEFYINNIYFANGLYGIEAAAQGYFDAHVSELTISELAFLVGIPNNPSKYDPFTNFDEAVERRNHILAVLHDYGSISDNEYEDALAEEIVLSPGGEEKHDSVETFVYYCATRSLMKVAGFTFRDEFIDDEDEAAYKELYDDYYSRFQLSLFTGGYRIYTAIDMEKQELLMSSVDDALAWSTEKNDEGVYKLQASAVCIDNATGYVIAVVGGRDQGLPGYTLNRAYQSFRQPGSAIKPLVVYAPYLGMGHNPDELIDDSSIEGGPENFEGRYPGEVTLTEALAWSSNVAAWKLFEQLTPEYGMSFVKKMHFRKIGEDEHYMAACLGGWSYGTSSLEMASAYAALANDGIYREPTAVMRITDSKGRLIVDNGGSDTAVYDKNAARMVSKMLQYGVEQGIATGARLDNAIVAVKTGTTTDNKDGWTVGYSAYYTTAVWVGCDIPRKMPDLTGGTYPMTIWKNYMHAVHEGLELAQFPDYTAYDEKKNSVDINNDDIGEDNGESTEETTLSIEEVIESLGDKSYEGGEGGDTNGTTAGGDTNSGGGAKGDASSTTQGGDSNSTTRGGDADSIIRGGDTNAGGGAKGDASSTTQGGDANSTIRGGDTNAGGGARGDANSTTQGGDMNSTTQGGDVNAGGVSGDSDASGNLRGDKNVGE